MSTMTRIDPSKCPNRLCPLDGTWSTRCFSSLMEGGSELCSASHPSYSSPVEPPAGPSVLSTSSSSSSWSSASSTLCCVATDVAMDRPVRKFTLGVWSTTGPNPVGAVSSSLTISSSTRLDPAEASANTTIDASAVLAILWSSGT